MALYAFLKACHIALLELAAILLADIFKQLAKELVESNNRYVHPIKISIDLLFAYDACFRNLFLQLSCLLLVIR